MPMLFGKMVIGPDCGNVGPLLRHWNYPVFSVNDISNVGMIIRRALEMEQLGEGMKKRNIQLKEYTTAVVSNKLYKAYEQVML